MFVLFLFFKKKTPSMFIAVDRSFFGGYWWAPVVITTDFK